MAMSAIGVVAEHHVRLSFPKECCGGDDNGGGGGSQRPTWPVELCKISRFRFIENVTENIVRVSE